MEFAHVRHETGFDIGLTYQVSADVEYFPSLVWSDPFVMLFYETSRRADSRFDLYGVCAFPSESWILVARSAEETEDRLRSEHAIPADIILLGGGELGRLLKSTGVRRQVIEALQLTSRWLRDAANYHPALTFYGA
jgi:hypothetical protein